jgi:two-component system response regulator NreC
LSDETALRVALLDDHEVVRSGLARVLETQPGITVCGEASGGAEAVELARTAQPDVFVVDLSLPGESGMQIIPKIREASPRTRVLVLTMHDDASYVRESTAAGANGYVLKQTSMTDIVDAVRVVATNDRYIDPSLGLRPSCVGPDEEPKIELNLTARELDVLRLIANGYTNNEVGKELYISVRTVETHRARIQQKLGVKSRAQLAQIARSAGLVR